MITLVTGGSGSGKSAYAESLLSSCEGIRYYIATMQIYDAEGEKKVERHRKLRAGKGFLTIESPMNVGKIRFACAGEAEQAQYRQGAERKVQGSFGKKSALLECMSNLTANEMFTKDGMKSEEEVVEKIVSEIQTISQKLDNLVIVTNNVFEDGVIYDAGTMEYLRALGRINAALARLADRVAEVVVGIPVELKG
ncbi:bifunctional adenosylcobinamide kinase/adenosylcobinamide-phosphate guanylyltransferase [bacterium]|nr:bifunctional adenosylcobinamide kinase/adenosylcobinamide-phosphate guanylyltransferase [bacterium]